ncbi:MULTISPECIES: nuclear transport factor 2 family protein [Streptomyces]|uniref:SnoaL-like domain-containing protein n=1 Tax=Streptomyces cacaoi TaxID=1898 RepID=A0A4Y3RCH2_STRCI|nr:MULTISPECIES: nuclear transport factor 2 family protein [Streptomyces]NNG86975.1 nuclear transport factor 2 family protein [Streptomyces cacaoi]QHF93842.1 nuclear transport factor 2 family protein [Streptomyces sp. NHF165]GEB54363.1 hypothetical protein SCA03_69140 [Streptomyces cacaoi]
MALTAEDRAAVAELLALHGHLVDHGRLDRLEELFVPDCVYDVSAFGAGVLHGPARIREAGQALGDRNPVAHHVTNIVLTERPDGSVHALSKGLGVHADGRCGTVTYEDVVVRDAEGPGGWRIGRRTVHARPAPLGAGEGGRGPM